MMADRFDVRITNEAYADLDAIFRYIEEDSPENARRMLARLVSDIEELAELPYRNPVWEPSRKPDRVVRSLPVPPYKVYYRVIEDGKVVRVLHVRHGARRQPKRFK